MDARERQPLELGGRGAAATPSEVLYLDANATTRVAPEVREAVRRAQERAWANPSSAHPLGRVARVVLEEARAAVGALLACPPEGVVLTSGATEANRLAIALGLAHGRRTGRTRVVASPIEHPAVLDVLHELEADGRAEVTWLPVGRSGCVAPADLAAALGPDVALCTLMWANNETGALQPVVEAAALVHEAGALLHTDGAQAVGRIPPDEVPPAVDLLTMSGHKMRGPKGVGALLVRAGHLLAGGKPSVGKPRSLRPGTPDVPGAAGLAAACRLARAAFAENRWARVAAARDRLEAELLRAGARRTAVQPGGEAPPRLPNTLNVTFDGVDGASLVLALARQGLCTSTGAACFSDQREASHVLRAMGIDQEEARGALRISLEIDVAEGDLDRAAGCIARTAARLRRLGLRGAAAGAEGWSGGGAAACEERREANRCTNHRPPPGTRSRS